MEPLMVFFGSKVTVAKFFDPKEYLNILYFNVTLRDSFGAPSSRKSHFTFKQRHYNYFC